MHHAGSNSINDTHLQRPKRNMPPNKRSFNRRSGPTGTPYTKAATRETYCTVKNLYAMGMGTQDIARVVEKSQHVVRSIRRKLAQGQESPCPRGGQTQPYKITPVLEQVLARLVDACADSTLDELAAALSQHASTPSRPLTVSASSVSRALKRMDITLKKLTAFDPRCIDADVIEARAQHAQTMDAYDASPTDYRLVYVDEANVNLSMTRSDTRSQGRSARGTKAVVARRCSRAPRINICLAISEEGVELLHTTHTSFTKHSFTSDVATPLVESLQAEALDATHPTHFLIILDNVNIHSKKDLNDLTREAAHVTFMFLPKYSPMLNPRGERLWRVQNSFQNPSTTPSPQTAGRAEVCRPWETDSHPHRFPASHHHRRNHIHHPFNMLLVFRQGPLFFPEMHRKGIHGIGRNRSHGCRC